MAHFFVVMNQDLENNDTVGNSVGIVNNGYEAQEGPTGSLYQNGDALNFGHAAGISQVVHDNNRAAKFVVLVDRMDTYQDAQRYFQRGKSLFTGQTTIVAVGEEAIAGTVEVNGKQTYQLFVRDRNISITIATVPTDTSPNIGDYFVKLVNAMSQRGHQCIYSTDGNITLLPLLKWPDFLACDKQKAQKALTSQVHCLKASGESDAHLCTEVRQRLRTTPKCS